MTAVNNPFCASRTRPGSLEYIFQGDSLSVIMDRLQSFGYRGQIVGPHGSGKSTLLLTIVQRLREHAREVRLVRILAGAPIWRNVHSVFREMRQARPGHLLAIDGYEQLPWLARAALAAVTRSRRVGLLVTTHRRVRLPILFRTQVTTGTARKVIDTYLDRGCPQDHRPRLDHLVDRQLPSLLQRHRGNLRDVMFELYDQFRDVACDRR
jgi:hypothetical protein